MFRNLPTFKSLPQVIGLPFFTSSEDAQLAFKTSEDGLKRLSGQDVIPLSDEQYWSQYWTTFNSAADVYSLISTQDIRQALQANSENVANLIDALSHKLFTLLPSVTFPAAGSADALNCLRVLGRILTVVYECEGEGFQADTFVSKHLYSRAKCPTPVNGNKEEPLEVDNQFTIADSDDEDDEPIRPLQAAVDKPDEEEIRDPLTNPDPAQQEATGHEEEDNLLPSLSDRLFSCTMDLLFCAGFTVPDVVRGESGDGDKVNYVIWEKGVGSTVSVGSTAELDRNKVEVLRFLVILVSQTMYTPPSALELAANPPLEHLTHALERRLVLSLLCSLLNTSLASPKSGVGAAVPYNHLVFKASEERRVLVRSCLMTLLIALDYRSFDNVQPPGAASEKKDENAFRYFISKLHRKDDFSFILGGILGILNEHMAHTMTYMPGSKKPVPYLTEAFMLLWRLVDLNKRFRAYVFESGKAIDLIGFILTTCLENKNDPAQHGLLRLLSYLLQALSADQGFAQAINQPLRQTVPAKWAVAGNATDFMIVSIYSIATTPGLNPLFPALTISIANAAPHLRHIGVQASTRLLQLFKAFSTPNFLLADEGHPRLVYYLLETFNSVLYYQLNENPNLVYAILRSHADFQALATFTLLSGLREIKQKKVLREKIIEEREQANSPARGLVRTDSELAMLAERATLLGREIGEEEDEAEVSRRVSKDSTNANDSGVISSQTSQIAESRPPVSEKARGKMRATESTADLSNEDDDEELMKLAQAGIGPSGYVPTQEWVSSWQKGLPLDPVLVAISELLPKIQDSQPPRAGGPSSKVFNLLKGAEIGDAMPPAPPIVPRKFRWSKQSCVWICSLLWGDVYVMGLSTLGIWRDTNVRLFGIKQAPNTTQVDRVLKMFGVA